MNFTLSDDHVLLRDSAHDFLRKEADLAPLLVPGAGVAQAGYARMWEQMSALGWPGLVIPESFGGHGMDLVDLAMVLRECGAHLAPSPLFGTLAGTWALLAAGSQEQKERLLPGVADGSRPLALAVARADGDCEAGNRDVQATAAADGTFSLEGTAHFVVDAAQARTLVVAALHEGVVRWFSVECSAPGVQVQLLDWRDITRQVCGIRFTQAAAQIMPLDHAQAWPGVRDRLWLALAAESAGGLQAVLDDTAAWARQRVAFGRPIGSFQAIKHQLADMLAQAECSQTAVLYAAWALSQQGHPDATLAAAMAQSQASEAYRDATHRSIQIFGAIGFTWEMKNHLYFKRARGNAALLGAPSLQRETIARILEQRVRQQDAAAAASGTPANPTHAGATSDSAPA